VCAAPPLADHVHPSREHRSLLRQFNYAILGSYAQSIIIVKTQRRCGCPSRFCSDLLAILWSSC